MKLTSFTVYDLAALDGILAQPRTAENQFAREIVTEIAGHVGMTDLVVTQYSTIFFGNILTDEGLVINHTETLSLNDDHDQADDLEVFYDTALATQAQFGVFCWFENETLTVLYFMQ